MAALARRLGFHDRPCGWIGDQRTEDRVVELVAAADRLVRAENRRASERKIADRVERLVTNEFIRVTQSFGIKQAVVRNDQCVLERSAERVARAPQLRNVLHEAEGA